MDPPQPPPETGHPQGWSNSTGGKDADGGRVRKGPQGPSRRDEHPGDCPDVPTFRRKIRQILVEPEPTPYVRGRSHCPKLGPFHAVIDQILIDDETAAPKQRHTAMQVFWRLVAEEGYRGGYDAVRRYIGTRRRRERPTFIPLDHEAGQRQEADFGHIHVDFPDGRRQVPVLLLTWGYSNAPFAIAMPTERIEAILAGTVAGFEFFGCVGREMWWDNPRTVATAILRGRQRRVHERYAGLANHYCFEAKFCMPASGWERPRVENRVYDLQRRWATPVPAVKDLDELNAHLQRCCLAELSRTVSGQSQTIAKLRVQLEQRHVGPARRTRLGSVHS